MKKTAFFAAALAAATAFSEAFVIPFGTNNLHYTLRPLSNGAVRITCGGYDEPEESLLERYALIDPLPEASDAKLVGRRLDFRGWSLSVGEDGSLCVSKGGKVLMTTAADHLPATAPTLHRNAGFTFSAKLADGEKIVGGGDAQRTRIALNGASGQLWIGNRGCHVPQPFYMSNRGWGVFFNTTRRLFWDVDRYAGDRARFIVKKQMLDAWLFTGGFYAMIDAYTQLTGRVHLPPEKSFGIWMVPFYGSDVNAVQFLTSGLRERKIPCDNISLEPGWMEVDYDQSVTRDWSRMRFLGCDAPMWRGPARILTNLMHSNGFNFGLWFCCQWDLTHEEERRVPASKRKVEKLPVVDGAPVPDGGFVDTRIGYQTRQDKITDPDKAYFDHMKKFAVQDGVDYFKLDGCCLQSEFPDRLYGNGKTDEEMHNLAFQLEAKQTFGDFEMAVTNKRAYGIYPFGTVGVQRYAGTWSGDAGGGLSPMTGILNASLCGHSLSTCDIENRNVQGIHMGMLLPWTLVDSWCGTMYPGFMNEKIDGIFREYANLRMTLVRYLYSLCREAARSGRPIARPLCLEYPEAETTYSVRDQFMMGDALLVSVYRKDESVFLPRGRWYDYWTGKTYEGADAYVHVPVPKDRGGHLFVREGGLVPTVPVSQYIRPGKLDSVEWLVFPSEKETYFDLYCDDGVTREYKKGAYAVQRVFQKNGKLSFGKIEGDGRFLKNVRHKVRLLGDVR